MISRSYRTACRPTAFSFQPSTVTSTVVIPNPQSCGYPFSKPLVNDSLRYVHDSLSSRLSLSLVLGRCPIYCLYLLGPTEDFQPTQEPTCLSLSRPPPIIPAAAPQLVIWDLGACTWAKHLLYMEAHVVMPHVKSRAHARRHLHSLLSFPFVRGIHFQPSSESNLPSFVTSISPSEEPHV